MSRFKGPPWCVVVWMLGEEWDNSEQCDPKLEFNCGDQTCIDISLKCDGEYDCKYRYDEEPSLCARERDRSLPPRNSPDSISLHFPEEGETQERIRLEIYRTGQIIAAFEILRKVFLFTSLKKEKPRRRNPGLNRRTLNLQSNALPLSYTPSSAKFALCSIGADTSRNIQKRDRSLLPSKFSGKCFSSLPEEGENPGLNRRTLNLQSNALPLSYTPSSAKFALCNIGADTSRNIQNGTDHCCLRNSQESISLHFPEEGETQERIRLEIYRTGQIIAAFEILRKVFLFTSLKKEKPRRRNPGLNRRTLNLQSNALPLSYTPSSAKFALCNIGADTSRNIQNGTDHCCLRNSQESISLHFPEEGETQNGTDHCRLRNSQESISLHFPEEGETQERIRLEIYRTGQIIAAFEILRKVFLFTSLKKEKPRRRNPGLNRRTLYLQSNALPLSYTPSSAKFALCSIGADTSRNIQNGTDHCCLRNSQESISLHFPEEGETQERIRLEIYRTGQIIAAFEILRKVFLFTSLKKEKPRSGYEKDLSRNIQNGTDHCRLRNSRKKNSLHFPEEVGTLVRHIFVLARTLRGIGPSALHGFPRNNSNPMPPWSTVPRIVPGFDCSSCEHPRYIFSGP
ncbi:hypothetical protein TNCV_2533321 [Trichonephila clavipes]|nr:hypothetical protein TNCV_2533321 [Trichonephila clavipes]